MWFPTRSSIIFIQYRVIWFRITPLSGMGSGMTTSKAEIRSVVTMSRVTGSIS
jgi:hypothetical protein